ncbi:MAG: BTAD domain-containing putative transcriptional regulator, partial [Acidimicrobiales bacterium]
MTGLSQLRIKVLGGLSVDGLDERRIGSRKGRRLLAMLVLARGSPVSVDRLADALWGDDQPARPSEQVAVLVSRLRTVLGGPRLPRSDAGYALRYDWLDLDELATRIAEAERRLRAGQASAARAAAEAALAVARGPLLAGEDAEWVALDRSAAERLVARARLMLAEAAVAAGDHGTAVSTAEDLLAADPYDEAALRALMRAHAAAGRSASALAAYSRTRERLGEDLGVPPSDETEALHDTIVTGGATAAAPVRPTTQLVGRDAELAQLKEAVAMAHSGVPSCVVVEGEAGIGKTTLLDAAAGWAASEGHLVLRCRCDAFARDLPLQPILDGLVAGLRAAGPDHAGAALGPDAAVLEPLLGWRPLGRTTQGATVMVDPTAGRAVLSAALLATVARLAGTAVAVVTVDDLHLADAATLEWMALAVRRSERLAVLGARRPAGPPVPPTARIVPLGPLTTDEAALLVGRDRAEELHTRSGGNPLFLLELLRSPDDLPTSVRQAVIARAEALGAEEAGTLRNAAVLGPDLDVDLLATVIGCPVAELLTRVETAVTEGLLAERGTNYAFAHDLIRDSLAAGVSAARRAWVHREAARALAARPTADPTQVAWHARLGGDDALAVEALMTAAATARARYEHPEGERLLSEAIDLRDAAEVRLARARLRMSRWDLAGAGDDAERALALGAGAAGLETAGWIAYYRRDWEAARRFAQEGAARESDGDLRASCLALAGRLSHSTGDLHAAEIRLTEAAACQTVEVRSVAQVWLATLRSHQGRPDEALDLAARALLEPERFGHPFGLLHAWFARCLALGVLGRAGELLAAAETTAWIAERAGEQGARFVPIAGNMRAWALRSLGAFDDAVDATRRAIEHGQAVRPLDVGAEPYHQARLDLFEARLLSGDLEGAAAAAEDCAVVRDWNGTMAWRARTRLALLTASFALATGEVESAAAQARA